MLMNSLDENVAEQPRELIACGATGKVLQDWASYHESVAALKDLKNDETLLVQSGKPAGVFATSKDAPRVLILNSSIAGRLPAGTTSNGSERRRYATSSQSAATSWSYIGTQGELPTAFHTLDAIAQKHLAGNLGGKLIVSGGMGAAGGALPLAAGLLGAAFLGIEVDEERVKRRIRGGYCDYCVNTLDEALRILKNAVRQRQPVSVGLVGNCAAIIPELASRGVVPDILTDQTSAHDLLNGYVPSGLNAEQSAKLRRENQGKYLSQARISIGRHFSGIRALQELGSVVFEFGNGIRAVARECGVENAFVFPDFVDYLQPLLSVGAVPVRWIALSGEPGDIRQIDDLALELFPDDPVVARWIPLAQKYVKVQGLPARVCWLKPKARIVLAGHVNKLVAGGKLKAPVIIAMEQAERNPGRSSQAGRKEHGSGSGRASGLPLPGELLKAASGASWVSVESNPGCRQASVVMAVDGTPEAEKAIPQVLDNGCALGILRQAAAADENIEGTPQSTKQEIPAPDKP